MLLLLVVLSGSKGHRCFLEHETLFYLLSTGWFQVKTSVKLDTGSIWRQITETIKNNCL